MKNKRVFISGGAGVIGRELVAKLVSRGAIVMVGDLEPIPHDFPKQVIYRQGDLNFISQTELDSFNPEVFFHLAATFERSVETYEHWEENFWHNIRLSNYLMTLMRNVKGLKRVVYASSYLIYKKELYNFDSPQEKPRRLNENDQIDPRNLTGLAKLAHEIELDFLSHFKADQFSSICARIYRGYGKNSRDVISRWIRDLQEGKSITVYNEEGFFDYMYAGDTAEGLIRLAAIEEAGIVNLGTGRSRRVADIVKVLRNYFPEMKVQSGKAEIKYEASEADTAKLQSLINWIPERDLENTIPEIIDFELNRAEPAKMEYGNVLITSVSRKIPLVNAVKKGVAKISNTIKVFGGDIDENCLGKYFVDDFWKMPRLSELSIEELKSYCIENSITMIIPSRDGELEFFSGLKSELASVGVTVMVSELASVSACLDKLEFANIADINSIPASTDIELIVAEKYVVKERYGAGAISIGINLNKQEALEHSKSLTNPIYQPFVTGYEISVDAYLTQEGDVKGLIMRRRDVVVNGESQITSTFSNPTLEEKLRSIIKSLKLTGHIILQAMINDKDDIQVIECNPRFGGASTLSIQAGVDSFYWAYLESLGESLKDYKFLKLTKPLTQVRYPQDFYL